jgi:hypothetical protein
LKTHLVAVAVLTLLAPPPGLACGYCDEDRIAAVYDHGVIAKALDRHHEVAFFTLTGPLRSGDESRRLIERALAAETAIDLASLRVSVDSASLSLAYDAVRIQPLRITDTLNRRLAVHGLRVSLLKVMQRPAR